MKLSQLQSFLREQNFNLAFFYDQDVHISYFTQTNPTFSFLMVKPKGASFYVGKLDPAPKISGVAVHVAEKRWEQQVSDQTVKKVGLNYEGISLTIAKKLKAAYPHATFIDISSTLRALRMQKTTSEMKKIQKACRITDNAFAELLAQLKKKKLRTEKDVALFLEQSIKRQGAELSFPTITAMGKNAAIPHHLTGNTKLTRGFLLVDFGARYQFYCADMTRVVFLGKPAKQEVEMYHLLLSAQQAAIAAVAEGKAYAELEKVARERLGDDSRQFIHSLGHGIGIEVHEHPTYLPEANYTVLKNHVFTIEPGIYITGKFGLRIEDTILFDGKVRVLTKAPKGLITISI
ncbi:aminopeptidase P family protein [Candidatus Woesearchaeota archaeon]|nr:aminopeptidase P family protein [Candidatus Woesearchaeota archaeon]